MARNRLVCALQGHDYGPKGKRTYNDLFGNEWKFRVCCHCGKSKRVLHRSFEQVVNDELRQAKRAKKELIELQQEPLASGVHRTSKPSLRVVQEDDVYFEGRYLGRAGYPCGRGVCAFGEGHAGPCGTE